MKKQKKMVPKRRFKEFEHADPWEQRKWSDTVDISKNMVDPKSGAYDDLPHVAPGNIESFSGLLFDNVKLVKNEDLISGKFRFNSGDVIYGKINPQLGKYYFARFEGLTSADAYVLNAKNGLNQKYLFSLLHTDDFYKYSVSVSKRSGMPKINRDELNAYSFMAPGYEEQERIGQFFITVDNLITLHQRKLSKLQDLKKSYLSEMFPQNGEVVPKRRFKGFTDPWEQRKVSDVAEICAGGTPSTTNERYWFPKEIPWLSSGEVNKKRITFTDNKISKEGMNNSSARIVPENSVLIALAGQGKTRGTVAINRIPLTTNQSIAAMTFSKEIVPEFVFCNLENRYDEIRKMSSGDGSRGGLNKQIVGDIEIPYISKEEQIAIANYFECLDNLITLHQRKLEKLQNIKKAYLNEMFI